MEILSIIPARGGSKGIPKKNIFPIAGKPLIAWTIEAAKKSRYISRTIVSTDDDSISEVSTHFGAEVIKRPVNISSDLASSELALLHTLEFLKSEEQYIPDLVVFLQCTSPLTITEDIDNCIEKLLIENADSALSVTDFHYFIWKKTKNGTSQGINHDNSIRLLRQERDPQYLETGSVYVLKTEGFVKSKHRFFGKIITSEIPSERVFEIDEPIDLQIAEILLREQNRKRLYESIPMEIELIVFDFDGVMTDNKVVVDQNGKESVLCNRSDGWGISKLKDYDISVIVLSSEENPIVMARCKKLKIPCIAGLGNTKIQGLQKWIVDYNINPKNIIYVGNDENDLECILSVGYSFAPSDAHYSVLSKVNTVLQSKGGEGVVREVCDIILSQLKR